MTRVNDIIFCLNSMNNVGQGVNANCIFTVLTPEYIPGLFSFSVIITLLDVDFQKPNIVNIRFYNDEETIGELEGPLPKFEEESNLPQEYRGINLSIDWNNMNLKKEGIYKISVKLDGEEIQTKEIYVKGKNQK